MTKAQLLDVIAFYYPYYRRKGDDYEEMLPAVRAACRKYGVKLPDWAKAA